MCGIAGFYSVSKNFSENDLQAMTNRLQHRGPDAVGYFINDAQTCGLGHRRLSIIDLSKAANQPMFSHSGRFAIIYNGEVYNFKEIQKQLNIAPKTSSDTEIILEAFAQRGVEFVHLLNGMFAIAIYDKELKALYLFRDRLGIKPIYIFNDGENFAFGSEIKALLQSKFIKNKLQVCKPSVYTFLYAGYIPEPFTIYENIQRLPSGSYCIVKNGEAEIKKYWAPEEKISANTQNNFVLAKEELKQLLTTSVNYRMISDVPFGTFLSGGIDSSAVTAIAQSLSAHPVKTFSIGFKESKFDESKHAKKVSEYLKTNHHEFIVSENDVLEMVDRMTEAYDEPYADSSAIPTMLVSKLARKYVTMTLSGDGGDELFLGYGSYDWAMRLKNPLLKFLRKPLVFSMSKLDNRYKRAAGVFNYKSEARLKSHIFSQEQYFFNENELDDLMSPAYRQHILFNEDFTNLKRQLSEPEEQALFDLKYYLKDDLLVKVDIATMQFSLETRTPFLDYRVVEFALNLSENLKKKNGVAKYLLKEVLHDYVPREYFGRPKWGFSIPLAKWLHKDLNYLISQNLNEESLLKAGIVKPQKVKSLIKRFNAGEDFLYNRIWALLLLHKWMNEHAT